MSRLMLWVLAVLAPEMHRDLLEVGKLREQNRNLGKENQELWAALKTNPGKDRHNALD